MRRTIVSNGDFTAYMCYSAATRPSSQITLGRLVRFRTQATNTSTTTNCANVAYYALTYNMASATLATQRVLANGVIVVLCLRCFEADDDAVAYDFDLLFTRHQQDAQRTSSLFWVLPAAQSDFSACLWLRMSPTRTEGTILSLGASQRTAPTDTAVTQDERRDISLTVHSGQVQPDRVNHMQFCSRYSFKSVVFFGQPSRCTNGPRLQSVSSIAAYDYS